MQLETLVIQFQKKDPKAFEKLYNMYAENICGVINTIVKNTDISQEICQDVFVKIWNNSDKYNSSKGRFFTWILNIARNAAIDEVRSKSHKNSKQNLSADYFVSILEDGNNLDSQMDAIGIKKFLVNLKDKCVQIIEMLYFKGYTQKEASEELDIPLGTIKTRNRSCISQLRKNVLD
ncbi:MAG: sigma-70 family RNA polymerase sigma factor [Cellulophaga sp.]|uniref:RNA polymerase sigma factor n=1 Tax=unclassified Cellulophaga TaxID=2634405 RepID=UPI000C2BFBD9|nr:MULTISPECIES: sigma-70 family RNA polymerase sigma factor [unclassified Cellulophaga]MDO6492302.1 sigma-70 family RNA polymerase sigma factor [Cellulophaga sp. 2_MG-2023]MDO6493252.1 sigma-70 family RNA polymerase sigma factor [Cellulophaga sp. 3_MG-2023]PKB44754.1 RNA polymerase sigma-70 factor (ECF subfamily) [Cellulophaga sp. RHA19]